MGYNGSSKEKFFNVCNFFHSVLIFRNFRSFQFPKNMLNGCNFISMQAIDDIQKLVKSWTDNCMNGDSVINNGLSLKIYNLLYFKVRGEFCRRLVRNLILK